MQCSHRISITDVVINIMHGSYTRQVKWLVQRKAELTSAVGYPTVSKKINFLFVHSLSFDEFLEVNVQYSICVCIVFPFVAYTCDDLCQKSFGTGYKMIRRAEFIEVQ